MMPKLEFRRVIGRLASGFGFAATLAVAAAADEQPLRLSFPSSEEGAAPAPGSVLARRPPPPALNRETALDFISWAAAVPKIQDDEVARILAEVKGDEAVAQTFCDEAFRVQDTDPGRALIALSLLGEMGGGAATGCLRKFVEQPLPETGTMVEGEIVERSRLEGLQAKAIEGIAYARTEETDKLVLEAIAGHPSRSVRADAIAAYLFNHDYSERALAQAAEVARPDERIFVERVVRRAGETSDTFNVKLRAYLETHPDIRPPAPEQRDADRQPRFTEPPEFNPTQP